MDVLHYHHRIPHITTLPNELLNEIAFYIACDTLVGVPGSLSPLLTTCKRIYDALKQDQAIWRRIFKFKFSWSCVERRGVGGVKGRSKPVENEDFCFQLKLYTRTLKEVKRRVGLLPSGTSLQAQRATLAAKGDDELGDEPAYREPVYDNTLTDDDEPQSVEELMWVLWVMCLEDDGCNRVQMDAVGVYQWVEGFAHRRLYRHAIEGWPRDNAVNSCALHVMWYLTTKERLFSESDHDREALVRILLPFVTIAFRYSSTFSPPNHFHLPLACSTHTRTTSIPTAHGPYPIYLATTQRLWKHFFYNRQVPTTIPLITDAAKLLYAARRELWKYPVMSQFARNRMEFDMRMPFQSDGRRPVGPTQEDFEELNESLLGGEAVDRLLDLGTGGHDSGTTGHASPSNPHGESRGMGRERERARGRGGGTALTSLPRVRYDPRILVPETGGVGYSACHVKWIVEIDESGCSSRGWDKDWWRLRTCWDSFEDARSFLVDMEDDESMYAWDDETCVDSDGDLDQAKETCSLEVDMQVDEGTSASLPVNVYTPGESCGLWVGKIFIPSHTHFESLIHAFPAAPGRPPRMPDNFSEGTLGPLCSIPVYMRLREHRISRTVPPSVSVPQGSMLNAWFPDGMKYEEDRKQGTVEVTLDGGMRILYETLRNEHEDAAEHWAEDDLILTGETDARHGQAWHHYRFYGRVRKWDGCVALLRVPADDSPTRSRRDRILFYGTLVGGGKNFVGNWRVVDADEDTPAWEGAFSLGKKEE